MNTAITRDVITDLLPLYLAGDASADTRALVEAFLASDPEFARRVRAEPPDFSRLPVDPAQELEMRALRQTRGLLRTSSTVLALALFMTFLPFSFFVSDTTGFSWIFLDRPLAPWVIWAIAGVAWAVHLRLRSRVSGAGV